MQRRDVATEPLPYPGDRADPGDVLRLADEYRAAAVALRLQGRNRDPSSWAPFRLTAIHAVELYLNALLRAAGCANG